MRDYETEFKTGILQSYRDNGHARTVTQGAGMAWTVAEPLIEAAAAEARAQAFADVIAHLTSQLATWEGTMIPPEHLLPNIIENMTHLEKIEHVAVQEEG